MPCNSSEGMGSSNYWAEEQAKRAMKEADKVTAILCAVLNSLPAETVAGYGKEVVDWLAEHNAHDRRQGR